MARHRYSAATYICPPLGGTGHLALRFQNNFSVNAPVFKRPSTTLLFREGEVGVH